MGIIMLIVYAVLMMTATLIFTKRARSSDGFHVADRNIGLFAGAMSIAATWIWAPALFVSAEKSYTSGIPGLFWFLVPNVLCLILFIPFAQRMRARYPQGITLTGFMTETYQSPKVKGVYSFQLGALAVLSTAVQLLAGGKLISAMTGIPFFAVTIILAVIAYSYSRFSGIKASITTDVVQLGIILLGCAIIVPLTIGKNGGAAAVIDGLSSITGDHSSLVSETGLAVFLGFGLPTAIGLLSGPFGDQCFWQRVFSIRRDRIGKSFGFGAMVFALVPLAMGLIGFTAAGTGYMASDSSMVGMEFITRANPLWIDALYVLMCLSGLLSTVDSNMCAVASMTTDWKNSGDNLRTSRLSMIVLVVLGILIANIPGLTVTHLFLFYGTLRASTMLPTVLTLLDKKLSARGVVAGVLSSLCIGLPVFAVGNIWNIPTMKTVGSLITVLLSGLVAVMLTRREARRC